MNDVSVYYHGQDTKKSKSVRDKQIAAIRAPLPALKWGQGNSRCSCLFRAAAVRKDFQWVFSNTVSKLNHNYSTEIKPVWGDGDWLCIVQNLTGEMRKEMVLVTSLWLQRPYALLQIWDNLSSVSSILSFLAFCFNQEKKKIYLPALEKCAHTQKRKRERNCNRLCTHVRACTFEMTVFPYVGEG